MALLTAAARKRLATSQYAMPSLRTSSNPAGHGAYPIPDLAHARNALARVAQFGTPAEQARVKAAVYAKFPQLKASKEGRR